MQITNRFIAKLIAIIFLFTISGCQTAMTTTSDKKETHTTVPNEWPLRFKQHSFSAYCYNTSGCKVFYNDFYHVKKDIDEVSTAPASTAYKEQWGKMPYGGIENFPAPAIVTWSSKDSVKHEAKIDLATIFKDQHILHNVPENEIPEGWAHNISPLIILEVNDRTINVYMRAYIATKTPQRQGSPHSDYRDELILAYSHTY